MMDSSEPWRRLGFTTAYCAEVLSNTRYFIQSSERNQPHGSRRMTIHSIVMDFDHRTAVAVFRHLGFVTDAGDRIDDWEELARVCPERAVYFFHGPWRTSDGVDPEAYKANLAEARLTFPWVDPLLHGLVWSAILGRTDVVPRLVTWVGDDLRPDTWADDESTAYRDFLLLMCCHLAGDRDWRTSELGQKLAATRKAILKDLLAVMAAIEDGDAVSYGKAMLAYLRKYQRSRFHTRSPSGVVTMVGTILWHHAASAGLGELDIPPELSHLVLRRATLYR